MRNVPAGVSKTTGKPYSSFMACPNRCKQPRATGTYQRTEQPTYHPQTPVAGLHSDKTPDWQAIREEKSDGIRENVALKMVSELLAAGCIPLDQWKEWTDNFYHYKPNNTDKILDDKQINEIF